LLLRHLNKSGGGRSLYRGGGSIGIAGLCRATFLLGSDPECLEQRILAQVKNNLAPLQPSLGFRIQGPEGAPTLAWDGPRALLADQLLAKRVLAPPASPRERAREFLADVLENGPLTSREIWAQAQEEDLAERTLHRARQALGIRAVSVWVEGVRRSYWLLPGQELPPSVPAPSPETDLEPWLAPLREKYPPATPLDDV
jgi:hypothetical protein